MAVVHPKMPPPTTQTLISKSTLCRFHQNTFSQTFCPQAILRQYCKTIYLACRIFCTSLTKQEKFFYNHPKEPPDDNYGRKNHKSISSSEPLWHGLEQLAHVRRDNLDAALVGFPDKVLYSRTLIGVLRFSCLHDAPHPDTWDLLFLAFHNGFSQHEGNCGCEGERPEDRLQFLFRI